MKLNESILKNLNEANKDGTLNLYNYFDKKYYEATEGETFDEICIECAKEIASGVETAEVKDVNIDPDGAAVLVVTNNGFAAWFDYYISSCSTDVEGDLPENILEGDWNAYIFHTDDPSDMITKYIQEDSDVFMIMETTGYNYLIDEGYVEETPIRRTNGMETSHFEWKRGE